MHKNTKNAQINKKKKKNRGQRKGKFSAALQSSLFNAQVAYEKQAAPAAMGTRMKFSAPATTSVAGGEIISGTSVLGEVQQIAGTAFWEINPGLSDIFPQVAPTATLFSEYKFRKLHFRYVPSVGSNEQGRVIFVSNRNVMDPPPTSFTEAASFEGATAVNVWEDMIYNASSNEWKYVRSSAYPEGSDPKMYDSAKFTVITENFSSEDAPKGTIIMDYVVEFRNRILTQISSSELMAPSVFVDPWTSSDATNLYKLFSNPSFNPIFSVSPPTVALPDQFNLQTPAGLWMLLIRLQVSNDYSGTTRDAIGINIEGNGSAIAQRIGSPNWLQTFTLETGDNLVEMTYLLYTPVSATVPDGDGSFAINQAGGSANNIWEAIPSATDGQANMLFLRLPLSAAALADPPLPIVVNAGPLVRRTKSHFIPRRMKPRTHDPTMRDLIEALKPRGCACCKH